MPSLTPTGLAPVLQLHPLRRCNLACRHCYTASSPSAREELPAELLLGAIDDAAHLGYRQLAVSGGEPLMYRALPTLLEAARGRGLITTVTTNGLLATPAIWSRLAPHLDLAAVSVDGTVEEHDALRGRAGALADTVANLATLRASGVPFGFLFTLTLFNVDSLAFVVQLAAREGARSVQVHPLTVEGRAADVMPGAKPDGIELLAALLEAEDIGRRYGVAVHVDAVTTDQLRAHRAQFVPAHPVRRLTDVAPVLIATAAGDLVPFTHAIPRALHVGSLHRGRLGVQAGAWLERGAAAPLVAACARAWDQLAEQSRPGAFYWYDAVVAEAIAGLRYGDDELEGAPVVRLGEDAAARDRVALGRA